MSSSPDVRIGWWDYEEFAGIGPSEQPICATPLCRKPTETRGLCNVCYNAWRRYGLLGLQRRAQRVSGIYQGRFKVPIDTDEALKMLIDIYEGEYIVAEREEEHDKAKKKILRICDAIGNIAQRKRQRDNRNTWKTSFIARFGEEAWKKRQAAAQRQTRERRRLLTGKDR